MPRRLAALLALSYVPSLAGAAPPPAAPRGAVRVAGSPGGIATRDGGRLIVTALSVHFQSEGAIVAYRRTGSGYVADGSARTAFPATDVALSPDGRTAVATTRVGLAAVDVAALERGGAKAVEVRDGSAPDANRIVFARDGTHVFFTVQRYATLGVARVLAASGDAPPQLEIVGHLKLDRSPGGLALSPDGATLYVTSEADTADPQTVAGATDSRLGRAKCAFNLAPHGVLTVLDAAKVLADPDRAVVARVAAGCAPTRVALSPDGATAWVSVRAENRVVAFDTAKLRADRAHALLASVPVGNVPVGLAVAEDGRTVLVANSNRSIDPDDAGKADVSVIDAAAALAGKAAVVATLPTGSLAREVLALPGGTFLVTNYASHSVDVIRPAEVKR